MGHYLVAACACLRKRPCWIPTYIVHREKENTAHHKDVESFQHCELTWHKECHPWGIAYHRVLASKCIKSSAILKPVLLTYDCIEVCAKCVLEQCRTSCMKCTSAQKKKESWDSVLRRWLTTPPFYIYKNVPTLTFAQFVSRDQPHNSVRHVKRAISTPDPLSTRCEYLSCKILRCHRPFSEHMESLDKWKSDNISVLTFTMHQLILSLIMEKMKMTILGGTVQITFAFQFMFQ